MALAVKKANSKRRRPVRDTIARQGGGPTLSKEYQAVFENSGKAMVIVEEDATISLANEEFEKLSGYTKEEIEGKKNWTEFVARDDRRRVKEYHLLRRTDPMLAPRSFEFRFLDRQEKIKNIVLTIGQIQGMNKSMASLLDVTDRRQAEIEGRNSNRQEGEVKEHAKKLERDNEALLAEIADLKREVKTLKEINKRDRTLIDNIDLGINLIDTDHNIVMANAEQSKRLRKPLSEIIGKKCYQEFEKRNEVCPNCPGLQTMTTGQPAEAETEAVRDDGSRFFVRIQTYPVFGHDGAMTGFVEIVEDISERKQAEVLLQPEKETFFTILQNALYGVALMESDGKHVYVNPEFTAITGYTLEDIPTGKDWMHKAYPDKAYRQNITELWKKDSKLGGTRRVVSVVCKNGETKEIETGRTPLENGLSVAMLVDITERKQMEEELRESEERFRMLAENMPFGISVMAPDRNFEYFNPEFKKIFGYTIEDIPDKDTWFKKAYPDEEYRKKVLSQWEKDVKEDVKIGEENPRIFTVRCKNGRDKIIDFRTVYLRKGKQYLVYDDITDRAKVQEALKQSEERFRRLVERMNVGLSSIDEKGVLTYANEQFCTTLGYSLDELIGRPTIDFYYNEETRKAQEEVFVKRKKGMRDPTPYEIAWKTKDGKKVYTILSPTPNFDADGRYIGSSAIQTDITERKQMEEALQKSQQELQTLMDASPVPISWADKQGNITYINRKHHEFFGYTLEDIPTIDEWRRQAYQDPAQRARFSRWGKELVEAYRQGGALLPQEMSITCKNGSIRHVTLMRTLVCDRMLTIYSDITERKQMEQELRESEERFRLLAENMPFGISVMAPDRNFEYFNPEFKKIFGYTIEDIPDKDTWFEKAYPDEAYRKEVLSRWEKDAKEDVKIGEENPRIFTVRCKNGQDKIIDFRTVYLKDVKQYLVYDDITDRAKVQEALKQSEERYRALVENVNLGIDLIDADHNIVMVNAGQIAHFKKPRSETIGKKCYQEFEKRDAVCPHCPGVQTMATGQPAEAETEGIRDDGSRFNARLQTFPIFGDDGTVTSFIEVVEDITERKQIEEELRESEERFRRLVETTKVGVSAIDKKGVITYANNRFCEIWGYPQDEIMGRNVFDFLDEENLKILKEQLAQRTKGSRESYEITWTRKDGSKAPTILSPTPIIDTDGRYKGSYGFITDISERKRMEDSLKRYAAELEQSNEEVKNFAYIVSHDLRVPLVNLKGYTSELHSALEVIGTTLETALPHLNEDKRSAVAMALHEDVPEALEFITNSVSRMDSFINSVLMLSRLGRRELKPEPIDMNTLVQTTLKNLSHQIQAGGSKVTVVSLPEVVADRTAMEQIMGNILGNAVKYLDPERPGQIEVNAQTNNGEQIFHIRDNGRGIAEEDMYKVFAPFRRAGKQDTPGEGMGLAYVQTLVRRQGGSIWCESEPGKGTTFTFTIPQHRAEEGDHVAP